MDSRAKAGVAIAVGAVVMAAVGGMVAWRHGVFDRPSDPVAVERINGGAADQSEGRSVDQSQPPSVGQSAEQTAGQAEGRPASLPAGQTAGQSDSATVSQSEDGSDDQPGRQSVPVAEWRVAPMTVFYRGGDGVSRAEPPKPMGQALEPAHQVPRPMGQVPVEPSQGGSEAPATGAVDGPLVQAPAEGPKPMSKDEFFR